jgi:hypothetical protein
MSLQQQSLSQRHPGFFLSSSGNENYHTIASY